MSDTHLPKRAKQLPAPLLAELPRADVVIHAGDWVDTATLDLLESRSNRFIGVYGNNDGPELRARLPEIARADLDGLRVGVVHETGAAQGRETRCAARFLTSTSWSSATATSPGTPRPRPACASSTRARPPTADASRTART